MRYSLLSKINLCWRCVLDNVGAAGSPVLSVEWAVRSLGFVVQRMAQSKRPHRLTIRKGSDFRDINAVVSGNNGKLGKNRKNVIVPFKHANRSYLEKCFLFQCCGVADLQEIFEFSQKRASVASTTLFDSVRREETTFLVKYLLYLVLGYFPKREFLSNNLK